VSLSFNREDMSILEQIELTISKKLGGWPACMIRACLLSDVALPLDTEGMPTCSCGLRPPSPFVGYESELLLAARALQVGIVYEGGTNGSRPLACPALESPFGLFAVSRCRTPCPGSR
jgi:hypothetical protein